MLVSDTERLSALIGDIYDAALDPALWPTVLGKISAFVEGSAAALVSLDIVSLTGRFFYSWGYDRRYIDLYLEKYIKLNPARVPITFVKAGDVRSISNLVP